MGVTFPFFIQAPRTELMRGFHATTRSSAAEILARSRFVPSDGKDEWLGQGIYFWTDEAMARWWAATRKLRSPTVLEANIVLGYCLDLTNSLDVGPFVSAVHRKFVDDLGEGESIPENVGDERRLDCAVFNKACELTYPPIESILANFIAGDPMFPGTSFFDRAHVQICVKKLSNILYPRDVGRRPE